MSNVVENSFVELLDKSVWLSLTKFVNEMDNIAKSSENKISSVYRIILYFEKKDVFKNKFNRLCIKPVIIKIIDAVDEKYIFGHKDILKSFNGQPIITCSESYRRYIPKDDKAYIMTIVPEKHNYQDVVDYYPAEMFRIDDKKTKEAIDSTRISKFKKDLDDEIPIEYLL